MVICECYLFNRVCHSTLYLFFLPKTNANPNKERNTDFGIGTNTKLWRVPVNWFALRGWIWTSPAVPTIWAHFSQGVFTQFSIYVQLFISNLVLKGSWSWPSMCLRPTGSLARDLEADLSRGHHHHHHHDVNADDEDQDFGIDWTYWWRGWWWILIWSLDM